MPQRLADLVGRAMIDPEFLADLQRSPESALSQYDLEDGERRAVREALLKLADDPSAEMGVVFRAVLLRRVAT